MSNTLDLNSSGIMVKDRDGENKQLSELTFPSEHQIVILDAEVKKADQKFIPRIPLSFQVRYNGAAEDPPALVMLVNPSTMTVSKSKKVNAEFTRGGHIVEEWGDMQDTLQFSGKIGGFYVLNPTNGFSGLNRYHRSNAPSFKNLMNLFMIYRNNGMVYDKTIRDPQQTASDRLMKNKGLSYVNDRIPRMVQNVKNRIAVVGDIYLSYDGVSYKGSFDDFSIEESADSPYTLSYKFSFVVQSKVEEDKRSIDTYSQRNIELGDISKSRPTSTQNKQINQIIERGMQVSQQSSADEKSELIKINKEMVNPNHITTPQQITRSNIIEATVVDQVAHLNSQGLKTDSGDVARIRQSVTSQASTNFTSSNKGDADSVNNNRTVLSKNGYDLNSKETTSKAVGLAAEQRRNLNEKQKIANSK